MRRTHMEQRTQENLPSKLLKQHRTDILWLAQQHGARHVRVFGSAARAEAQVANDLDLLIELEPGRSLLDRVALIQDLEELLGISVDVVTTRGLHPSIRDEILQHAYPLMRL